MGNQMNTKGEKESSIFECLAVIFSKYCKENLLAAICLTFNSKGHAILFPSNNVDIILNWKQCLNLLTIPFARERNRMERISRDKVILVFNIEPLP